MRAGRRTPLAAASAAVGVACAVAPALTWLSTNGHKGHCGWTCYVPTSRPVSIASLGGRGGMQVAPVLGIVLFAVAVLAAVALVGSLRSASGPPVLLGWTITAVGFASLVATVVVIVRYAEGGTVVRTTDDGIFSANPGPGAVVALVAAAGSVLLGGAIALRPGTTADTEQSTPGTVSARPDDVRDPGRTDPAQPSGSPADGDPASASASSAVGDATSSSGAPAGGGSAPALGSPDDGGHARTGAGYASRSRS